MKKIATIIIWALLIVVHSFGQQGKSLAPIKMRLTNGQGFTNKNISARKAVILFYFSPECEHCEALTQSFIRNYKSIANKQLVMVTYFPINQVIAYDRKYSLSGYPNIFIGSEGYTFNVQKYYGIHQFPYIALYSKSGKFVRSFSQRESPDVVISAIKRL